MVIDFIKQHRLLNPCFILPWYWSRYTPPVKFDGKFCVLISYGEKRRQEGHVVREQN